jgi:hypothetical protein
MRQYSSVHRHPDDDSCFFAWLKRDISAIAALSPFPKRASMLRV